MPVCNLDTHAAHACSGRIHSTASYCSLSPSSDRNYYQCWLGLKSHFDPEWTPEKAATLTASREAALQAGGAPAAAEGAVPAAGGAQEHQNGQGSAAELAGQA